LVEIKDRNDLDAWLNDRPREDAIALAARTALRIAPISDPAGIWDGDIFRGNLEWALTSLAFWRAVSVCWLAAIGTNRGKELKAAANMASAAAYGNFREEYSPASTIAYAWQTIAIAVTAVADDRIAALNSPSVFKGTLIEPGFTTEAVISDANMIYGGVSSRDLASRPLWFRDIPNWVARDWPQVKRHLLAANEGWEVWTDWYEDRLRGRPFNKALEEARVLIDADLWEQGPKAVNAEIARLIEAHVAERTPLAGKIAINPKSGDIRAEPPARRPDIPDGVSHERLVRNICEKLGDQIDYLREPQRWNQFSALARQFDRIEGFLDEPTLRPERLHDAFEAMVRAIDIRLREKEIPDGEETSELRADVLHGMFDLRHCYPDLDAMIAARSARRPKTLSAEEAAALERILGTVEEIVEHELEQELREDVEAVKEAVETLPTEARNLPLPEGDLKNRVYRLIGTLTRIKNIAQIKGGDLVRLLDRGVDAVQKVESYRKVAEALEPVWQAIWDLLKSFLD
jgi:hypothetical protein